MLCGTWRKPRCDANFIISFSIILAPIFASIITFVVILVAVMDICNAETKACFYSSSIMIKTILTIMINYIILILVIGSGQVDMVDMVFVVEMVDIVHIVDIVDMLRYSCCRRRQGKEGCRRKWACCRLIHHQHSVANKSVQVFTHVRVYPCP